MCGAGETICAADSERPIRVASQNRPRSRSRPAITRRLRRRHRGRVSWNTPVAPDTAEPCPQRGRPSSSGSRHPRRIAALALEPVQPVPVLVPVRVRLVSVPVRAPAQAGCLLAQRRPHRRHRARSALGSRTIRWSSRLSQPASPTVRTCVSRRSAVRHTGSGTTCSTAVRTPRRNRISAGLLARPPRADCMGHSPVAAAGQR